MSSEDQASDLSHSSIFNPDTENDKRRVWSPDYFFNIVLLISGWWVKILFRIPSVLMRHSGIAFMIAFCIVTVTLCIPLAVLETFVGQYGGKSFLLVMTEMMPVARGVGYAIVVDHLLEAVVYGAQVSQLLIYCYYSFKPRPPWEECNDKYNSPLCQTPELTRDCMKRKDNLTSYVWNRCATPHQACSAKGMNYVDEKHCSKEDDLSNPVDVLYLNRPTGQQEYFTEIYEQRGWMWITDAHKLGPLNTGFAVSSFVLWVLVMLGVFGTQIPQPHIPYVAYTIPLALYVLFMLISFCLPGSGGGIADRYYFKPQDLGKARCWGDAATLAFACMSIGYGVLPYLAARNAPQRRSYVDVVYLGGACLLFTTITSYSFYALAGYFVKKARTNMPTQLQLGGQDLARVYFATLMNDAPPDVLWSVLYFFVLTSLGVGSLVMHIVCIVGELSSLTSFKYRKHIIFVAVGLFGALTGLLFANKGASFLLDSIESPIFGSKKVILSLLFVIVVIFLYGRDNMIHHIEHRLRVTPCPPTMLCRAFWWVVCPLGLTVLPILAVVGRGGEVFNKRAPALLVACTVIYEFYYWLIIGGVTAWAWFQPKKPRGVWRLERDGDDVEVATPESFQQLAVEEQNSGDSWQTCA